MSNQLFNLFIFYKRAVDRQRYAVCNRPFIKMIEVNMNINDLIWLIIVVITCIAIRDLFNGL